MTLNQLYEGWHDIYVINGITLAIMKPYRLTDNLAVAEQCETRRFSICTPRTDIGTLVEKLVADVSTAWGRQSDLQTRIEYFEMKVSRGCLSRLLSELVDNSFRYSRKGTNVSVSSRQEFGRTIIQIENSAEIDDYMEVMARIGKRSDSDFRGGIAMALESLKQIGGDLRVFYRKSLLRMSIEFPN